MSFKVRIWALGKFVSSLALIVSTCFLTASAILPSTLAESSEINGGGGGYSSGSGNSVSNITILDLYPELKEYLYQKALSQLEVESTTESYNIVNNYKNFGTERQQELISAFPDLLSSWNYGGLVSNNNGVANTKSTGFGNANSAENQQGTVAPGAFSRGDYADSDPMDTFNQYSEILKYYHPFGTPESHLGWKYNPHPVPAPQYHPTYPVWDEAPEIDHHIIGHGLTKDVSLLAGILGLKSLTELKISKFFKTLKLIAVFIIAFKLGVLLSPIAIPLLFPIILLSTITKLLPLILIIVLLLKILKKQVKPKKPFGKLLQRTSSLFFDDIDLVTERVLKSEECIDKISCNLSRKYSDRVRRVNDKRLEESSETVKTQGDNT